MPPPIKLPDLVIPSGAQVSNAISFVASGAPQWVKAITIYADAVVPEGAATLQTAHRDAPTVWKSLQSGGADITLAAAKALVIEEVSFDLLRLSIGSNAAADRTYKVTGREDR